VTLKAAASFLAVLLFATQVEARAPKKRPPAAPTAAVGGSKNGACGINNIPLVPGNSWTYKNSANDKRVTVKVMDVSQGKDHAGKAATVITVEETFLGATLKATWTCTTTGGLVIAPESMFFAAEPGGGVGITTAVTSRDSVTFLPDAALNADARWVEKVLADIVRSDSGGATAKHPAAKVEIQRHITDVQTESVNCVMLSCSTSQWNAMKIIFELRGEAVVEAEKYPLPAKPDHPGTYWIVRGLGIVKMQDNNDSAWELVESTLK
jgi:hypothetical protein